MAHDEKQFQDTIPPGFNMPTDTLVRNEPTTDSLRSVEQEKPVIDAPIDYTALDSMIVSLDGQKVYLYNGAKVTYQNIELEAYYIELDLETKEIYAEGIRDSVGEMTQKPLFKQGSEEYESETMRYNFETEKAFITKVVSAQGEGFIHSNRTKKIGKEVFITKDAMYTTCDADHPHFYLNLTKAKVISNNKIITGPAYMVLEDFPIYFPILPFGYFPNSPTYSSGILLPKYGEEQNRGFFLRDGGYYWAASQYFDLAVQGDIYSRGSWGTRIKTNYKQRYKFNGNFGFEYAKNKYGEKGLDTYSQSTQYKILWSHSQDPKANPNQTFSASVNISSSGYDKQNANDYNDYLTTTKSSSISYSRKFENTPFNLSVNLRHSQNTKDSTMSLSLPEMTFNMAKVYPFRKKNRSGKIKFYENFGINYTANLKNSISAKEDEILSSSFATDWKNGIRHNLPISFPSFSLGPINFS
ncbi:MAG TPA: putative LPS assembly protein LptD, partial [Draconibacterium sp.]|nr:putative LPS assembly protein LptD [Draconibacterium sp.]